MEIEPNEITVQELVSGYEDNKEDGVFGFDGKLNIRPPYQREFVYDDKERDAVIVSLSKGFPLNVMYWITCEDGKFEIIDGQQRTVSICKFVAGDFSMSLWDIKDPRFFHNLQDVEQEKILKYKLMVYHCTGNDKERLKWFETINIAGKKLTQQELRNAIYHGPWVSDARRYFSKTNCPAHGLGHEYMKGSPIRQHYLEKVIQWMSDKETIQSIGEYMAQHQNDTSAISLWEYFQEVISWTQTTFPQQRDLLKGVEWGILYNKFGTKALNSNELEKEIARLIEDEDVQKNSGIYSYVLTRDEKELNLRAFSDKVKNEAYGRQKGICKKCKEHFEMKDMEADHIKPWSKGGKTVAKNCQMLCKNCNRRKSNK